MGAGGGINCSLVPLKNNWPFPLFPKIMLDLLCSLFPKIAFVPLFPSVLDLCFLIPLE